MKKLTLLSLIAFNATLVGCGADDETIATEYDTSRPYYLPYEANRTRKAWQVAGGNYSHNATDPNTGSVINLHAFDFAMQIGSVVVAARDGRVYHVEESETQTCGTCAGNGILVTQGEVQSNGSVNYDGTVGSYHHLDTNKVCVEPGDIIRQGDIIALSGNTGNSSGPHLHFEVKYLNSANAWIDPPSTLPKFVDVDAGGTGTPRQYSRYTSANETGSSNTDWCTQRAITIPNQSILDSNYETFLLESEETLSEEHEIM